MTALSGSVAGVGSPWDAAHRRTTGGIFALAFLFAFEALAVASIMPLVATELDGLSWYAIAFAAPMATGVVALTVTGPWADRHGPAIPMATGLAIFVAGVMVAGIAGTMPVFLVGRLVHGFGGGMLGVTLYVLAARAYPVSMRPRVFVVLTSAWILPALIGPGIAAGLAHTVGWRWVFLGVPLLAVPSWLVVRRPAARLAGAGTAQAARWGLGVAAAGGVLGVALAGQREVPVWPAVLSAALVVTVVAARTLLPAGTWRARPGLPATLLLRGLIGSAFAGTEVYLPLVLTGRGLPLGAAGAVLGGAAISWFVGSWWTARVADRLAPLTRVRVGAGLVATGALGVSAGVHDAVPVAVVVLAWLLAGFGIGSSFATLSVVALGLAPAGGEGATSSALQVNDQLTQAVVLSLGSVAFAALVISRIEVALMVVTLLSASLAAVAFLVAGPRRLADATAHT